MNQNVCFWRNIALWYLVYECWNQISDLGVEVFLEVRNLYVKLAVDPGVLKTSEDKLTLERQSKNENIF